VIKAKLRNRVVPLLERHLSGESMDYREIIAIFIPVLVDQAFVLCMNLVNTAMISSSGVAAVSAVNMVDSLNNFLVSVFIALSVGGTVVVAQFKGVGNEKMVSRSAAGSVTAVFLMALALSVLLIVFHKPMLALLFGNAAPDVFHNAQVYIIGSAASYCGIATEEAVCGALRGIGETKSSLALSLTMNLTYVLFNFLTINLLHMGIYGMSVSINIARYFAAVVAIVYVISFNNTLHFHAPDLFHLDFSILRRICYVGIPFAAEQLFFNGGKILTQTFVVSLGTLAITVNAISGSISGILQIPANALSLTVVTVVGQCMGRRDVKDARKFIRSFLLLASLSSVVLGVLILPFFRPLVSLFNAPAQIIPTIFLIIMVNWAAQTLLWPISFITPSALRAAGDSKFTSVVAMLSMWLFRVVFGYILGIVLKLGIFGVWLAMDLEWSVRGSVFYFRSRGDKWYRHHVID
jgi:putative MATE family efflux protein